MSLNDTLHEIRRKDFQISKEIEELKIIFQNWKRKLNT